MSIKKEKRRRKKKPEILSPNSSKRRKEDDKIIKRKRKEKEETKKRRFRVLCDCLSVYIPMLLVPIVSVSGQLVIWFVKCLRDEKKRVKNNTTHKNNNNNNGNDNTNRCSRVNTKFRESCCVLNVVRYIQYARGKKKKERKR